MKFFVAISFAYHVGITNSASEGHPRFSQMYVAKLALLAIASRSDAPNLRAELSKVNAEEATKENVLDVCSFVVR